MAAVAEFLLPDVGEGLTEAEILQWYVKVGDVVEVNQSLVEVETAKAAVDLPSPWAGTVSEITGAVGDILAVGTVLVRFDLVDSGGERATSPATTTTAVVVEVSSAGEEDQTREPVLVGYGVLQAGTTRRRPRAASPSGALTPEAGPPGELAKPVRHGGLEVGRATEQLLSPRSPALAKPPVRRLARDLGVDLSGVEATGDGGVVTREDVERAGRLASPSETVDEERIPVRGVARAMAEAMVRSAFTAPHVTEWVELDVTRSVKLTRRLREAPEFANVRVSILLLTAYGLLRSIGRNPGVNATWTDAEIVRKHYVNLGIAAATPRGLLVPNIKGAQALSLVGLAQALDDLVRTAREGRSTPEQLTGGTITITNVGVFGVDGGTPILNPGEAAILCLGQIRRKPWVHKGKVRPRDVLQLSLSFDHRLVDGALGSTVLADVAAFLQDPVPRLASVSAGPNS